MNRFDIRKVKKPTLSGNPNDPTVYMGTKLPESIKARFLGTPKKKVLEILDKHLLKLDR